MPDHPDIPVHFRGMAIRLEDEVLVGQTDPVILSVDAPIEIVDVEACCQRLLDSQATR
jgi:intermediate cleaving peptidase 55